MAIHYFEQTRDSQERNLGAAHVHLINTWNQIATAWVDARNYDRAIECHNKALEISLTHYSENHPSVALTCKSLGMAWHYKGDADKAFIYVQKALNGFRLICCADHPLLAQTWNHLGLISETQGDLDEARNHYQKALDVAGPAGLQTLKFTLEQKLQELAVPQDGGAPEEVGGPAGRDAVGEAYYEVAASH